MTTATTMQSHSFSLPKRNTTLHALISTPPSPSQTPSKPTILFLHFWGGSSRTFHRLFPLLSPQYVLIALDHRGWVASTGPHDAGGYGVGDMAGDVLAVIPELRERGLIEQEGFVLVGHSMGAKVGMAVAGAAIKVDGGLGLRGMVLLAPAPPTPLVLPTQEMREQQMRAYESRESVEWMVRNVLCGGDVEGLGEKGLLQGVVDDALRGVKWAREAWPGYGMGEDVSEGLERGPHEARVQVLAGEMDRVETVERVEGEVVGFLRERGWRRVGFEVVGGCGHLMPLEKPEVVVREIEKVMGDI